jgi:hypothetical protein
VREGGRKKKEKGEEMRWGWLRFFFRGDDNISYFPVQEGEKRGKANNFFTFACYDSDNNKSRQGKARGTIRYEKETRGEGADQTRPDQKSIIWQKGMEPNQTIARSGKGKGKRKGKLY